MRKIPSKQTGVLPVLILLLLLQVQCIAQDSSRAITFYQFRYVPPDKTDEFIKRETTYWSKVAQKAIDKKLLSFWGLFEKVSGSNMEHSPNYFFSNTYPDIDKIEEVWSNPEAAAGVKISAMETNSMSTATAQFFLHDENWAQSKNADPTKEFNYVVMVFHSTNYPDSLIHLEKQYWAPFIQTAMDNGQTPQRAWGNAVLLSPTGEDVKFNTVSYDIFKTLADALMPQWKPDTKIPVDGLNKITAIETGERRTEVYRIVKVVAPSN